MHGVTDVWHSDTLDAMAKLIQEPMFWCRRSGDALIRAMGGPYVLGQEEDQLKLVRGSPHTELTRKYFLSPLQCFRNLLPPTLPFSLLLRQYLEKMCIVHSLVYAAVHLALPAAPGVQYFDLWM